MEDWRDAGVQVAESIEERTATHDLDQTDVIAPKFYRRVKEVVDRKIGDAENLPRRKILLLMSDGADKRSTKPKSIEKIVDQIAEAAKTHGTKIYAVGCTLADRNLLTYLKSLASKTGGVYREISEEQDFSEIPSVIGAIGDELKRQYVIDFTPGDDFEGSEERVSLRLDVKTPDDQLIKKEEG